jgi:antitoxin component YwqK of YwqJK toxin-antitoxin module
MKRFIILIFTCSISALYAQKTTCKPKVKANKNKTLVFQDLQIEHASWLENGMEIKTFADSIVLEKNGEYFTSFKVKNNHIIDKTVSEYYPDGKLKRFDSLATPYKRHSNTYYRNFTGWAFYTRYYYPSGIPKDIVYYQMDGEDSLKKSWSDNGTLRKIIWNTRSGYDSATYTWSSEGILQSIKKSIEKYEYYATGILKSSETDTVIGDGQHFIVCKKEYYPSGTLRSVAYYFGGNPCLDWLYYTEQGILEKKVKKTPQSQLKITFETGVRAVAEEKPKIFTAVNEPAEFAGGTGNLTKYLNEKLTHVACESNLPLTGTYDVMFTIDTYGAVSFKGLKGANSTDIDSRIQQIINQMPKWKPGKQNGRNVITAFHLQLRLKDNK